MKQLQNLSSESRSPLPIPHVRTQEKEGRINTGGHYDSERDEQLLGRYELAAYLGPSRFYTMRTQNNSGEPRLVLPFLIEEPLYPDR